MSNRQHHLSSLDLKRFISASFATSVLALSVAATLPAHAANYTWGTAKIGGNGYVPGIIAHPGQTGLFYARTDVGGAYRYSNGTWIQLNDWTPASSWNNGGVDSIAIDPNNTSKLYMVTGEYYDTKDATVLISSDQGNTFTKVSLGFGVGGNAGGRQVGERLQVDPNLGSILFYGTGDSSENAATNGLWKSTNGGLNWNRVATFSSMLNDGNGAGIAFVAFQKSSSPINTATKTMFVGINSASAANASATIYRSDNGGGAWTSIGGPAGLMPQSGQVGPDGNLYVTFSKYQYAWGPEGLYAGEVYRYSIAGKSWAKITPANNSGGASNYGFAGLSVDPKNQGHIAVKTVDRYDNEGETMFYSIDGGDHWIDTLGNSGNFHLGNWGAVLLDPNVAGHAFATSGGGITETTNLNTSTAASWHFAQNGVEEVAIAALMSPSQNQYGAPLVLSGGWDVCGYTHTSLTTAPSTPFSGPSCSKATGLDYAKSNSTYVVRVEEDGWNNGTKVFGAISWNGGYTWSPFNSNGPSTQGGGMVAVNADGSAILWSPQDVPPVYSSNNAWSWNSLSGTLPKGVKVVADGYNANLFYAYDRNVGTIYISNNKGVSWQQANATIADANGNVSPMTAWAEQVAAVPGIQGDLWIATHVGLYHTTSSGYGQWSRAPGFTDTTAVGFGKAATGASYPAIYVSGTINNVAGVYRSTDGGNTWLRINDNQHQWGGVFAITGDPKTFGTVYLGTSMARGVVYGTSSN